MSLSVEQIIEHSQYVKAEILEKVVDKHIYIVGTKNLLSDVRMNAPYLVRLNEAGFWGDCDLWVTNSEIRYFDDSRRYKYAKIARMPASDDPAEAFLNYSDEYSHNTYFIPLADREATIKASGIKNPLLCTLTAYWFHRYTKNNITLINCSFNDRVNRYPEQGVIALDEKYSPKKDAEFLASFSRIEIKTVVL